MGTEDRLRPYISELADKLATEWLDRTPDYSAWKHPTEAVATKQMEEDALERLKQMNAGREDMVNNPSHYNKHPKGIECIEVIEDFNCPNLANVVKYAWRVDSGGKWDNLEDLKKAEWYIRREIKRRTQQ